MIHYHGTPIGGSRQDVVRFLSGRHALVPFARPDDLGAALEAKLEESSGLLGLIADIRKAAGDPEGKLMQAELVELIARQRGRLQSVNAAGLAVVDRWETPLWKDAPATAGFIYALRDAIAAGGGDGLST